MTVKELIDALSNCEPNAKVYGYNEREEGDFEVYKVDEFTKITEDDLPYCKSSSEIEEDGNIGNNVVILR